ncbi:MAG: hypothetical protein AAFP77_29935 [Bacteroidota bacterium]
MTRSAIMAQGLFRAGTLDHIRDRLRAAFRVSGLHHTIDQRYVLETAHATLIRFTQPLAEIRYLLAKLSQLRRVELGTFEAEKIELVTNDWYQRKKNTRLLQSYPLIPKPNVLRPS